MERMMDGMNGGMETAAPMSEMGTTDGDGAPKPRPKRTSRPKAARPKAARPKAAKKARKTGGKKRAKKTTKARTKARKTTGRKRTKKRARR
jgi:hypothetical protein